jgi:hypothetical protein
VTWENDGSHSGSWWFHGKDGVAGSIPAGGSTKAMTSANAGHRRVPDRQTGNATSGSRLGPVGLGVYRIENASLVLHLWSVTVGTDRMPCCETPAAVRFLSCEPLLDPLS